MSCKTCNTNCIEAGTRDDQMCSAWTKRDDADMGNYFAKLAKMQTNIRTAMEKQTNADRIRSMTDEELAKWLNNMQGYSFSCGLIEARISEYPNRYNAWLEWLKEEVKDDGHY